MEQFVAAIRARGDAETRRIEAEYTYASKQQQAFVKHNFILRPEGRLKKLWDWLVALTILASLIMLPLFTAFGDGLPQIPIITVAFSLDAIWWVDMLVTFRTAIARDGAGAPASGGTQMQRALISQPRLIAHNYLTTAFPLDVVAGLPLLAMHLSADGLRPSRLATAASQRALLGTVILSLLPLLSLHLRVRRVLRSEHVRSALVFDQNGMHQLGRIVLGITYLIHLTACLYWFVCVVELRRCLGKPSGCADLLVVWDGAFTPPTMYAAWLDDGQAQLRALNATGDLTMAQLGADRADGGGLDFVSDMASCYLCAFVWSALTLTGLALERPKNALENLLMVVMASSALLVNAVLIGSVSSVIGQMNHARTSEQNQRKAIAAHLEKASVPKELRRRIDEFYNFVGGVSEARPESELLPSLPTGLQSQLDLLRKREIFTHVPLFRSCTFEQIMELIHMIERVYAMPGRVLICAGRPSTGLFVICRGSVSVANAAGVTVVTRIRGEFVGDHSLLDGAPEPEQVVTAEFCELFLLKRDDFAAMARRHPQLERTFRFYATHKDDASFQAACTKQLRLQQETRPQRGPPAGGRSGGDAPLVDAPASNSSPLGSRLSSTFGGGQKAKAPAGVNHAAPALGRWRARANAAASERLAEELKSSCLFGTSERARGEAESRAVRA